MHPRVGGSLAGEQDDVEVVRARRVPREQRCQPRPFGPDGHQFRVHRGPRGLAGLPEQPHVGHACDPQRAPVRTWEVSQVGHVPPPHHLGGRSQVHGVHRLTVQHHLVPVPGQFVVVRTAFETDVHRGAVREPGEELRRDHQLLLAHHRLLHRHRDLRCRRG